MKCPNCGQEMLLESRDVPYVYKGKTVILVEVTGEFCPNCGEAVLEMAESARVSREMINFNQKVDENSVV